MAKGDYEFFTLVTCLLILALQIHNPFQRAAHVAGGECSCPDTGRGRGASLREPLTPPAPAPPKVEQQAPVYRRPREVTPSAPAPGGLSTDALLRELDSIQAKAKEQQDTLAAAGRMPPPSPILQQLKEIEAEETPGRVPTPASMPPAALPPLGGPAAVAPRATGSAPDAPMLRRRGDFGRFLEARQPRGLGVVLGVGRGDFALRLLADWASAQGVYLVDPFIHIWQGYDDPSNLDDRAHQAVFEELRNRLAMYEGRYVLVRDFSHSFAETYRSGGTAPGLPSFIYIDANHAEKAVERDLSLWWPLLAPGGVLAGSTYTNDATGRIRVQSVVDQFAAKNRLSLYLTHDDVPPSWFIFKP